MEAAVLSMKAVSTEESVEASANKNDGRFRGRFHYFHGRFHMFSRRGLSTCSIGVGINSVEVDFTSVVEASIYFHETKEVLLRR